MILKRFYRWRRIETGNIRAVRDVLKGSLGWGLKNAKYHLFYPSEEIRVDRIDEVDEVARTKGQPNDVLVEFDSEGGRWVKLVSEHPDRVVIEVNNLNDSPYKVLERIEPSLSLVAVDEVPSGKLIRSAFVCHAFDTQGHGYANEVGRFLTLLDIKPHSGRGFSTKDVDDKVMEKLTKYDLIVGIVSEQEASTWIIQETAAAKALQKPLFILKEHDAEFRPGLLGNFEYIPFKKGQISEAFIPMLEGLRELRGIDSGCM